jgi:hypothetical protein
MLQIRSRKKRRTQNTENFVHRTQETSRTEQTKRIHGTVILKWIFNKRFGGMEWLGLSQNRDRWGELVNAVLHFRVPSNTGNFLTS